MGTIEQSEGIDVRLTGGKVVAKGLRAYGVAYAAGVPGQGSKALLEALQRPGDGIPFIRVVQAQSAVHMADGYFRACGRAMAIIFPSRSDLCRAVDAIATCHADSSAVLLLTGGTELNGSDRSDAEWSYDSSDAFPQLGISIKRGWRAENVNELQEQMQCAFDTALSARPGPIHVEIPAEVQLEATDAHALPATFRGRGERLHGDPDSIERAVRVLSEAERPVVIAGGGVVASDACSVLLELAEIISAPVVTSGNGFGTIPSDHPLDGGPIGRTGSYCANTLLRRADVILSIGSSLIDLLRIGGDTFDVSPLAHARLIQIDIDPAQLGKRHAVEVGIVGDAREVVSHLKEAMQIGRRRAIISRRAAFVAELHGLKSHWRTLLDRQFRDGENLIRRQRSLVELRKVAPHDTIFVVGAGNLRTIVRQTLPVHEPRTCIMSGYPALDGWAVSASIGAKLAMASRQVVCLVDDLDFLQAMQEIAVCVMHSIPVVYVVYNNSGPEFISSVAAERSVGMLTGELSSADGRPYSPAFAEIARSFGLEAWRVEHPAQLEGVFRKALDSIGPALVEIMTARNDPGPVPVSEM
ncbi:thiamine pyrophosphate-binding protein [Burkholderia multivorans]|nr:thiamine pyrophosphate-binding protein [Burkholderia multivorans]